MKNVFLFLLLVVFVYTKEEEVEGTINKYQVNQTDIPKIWGECAACKDAMEVTMNSLFNTYACAKGIEDAVKLVCNLAGPYKSVCTTAVTLVCNACRYVTKDHCDWHHYCLQACTSHGYCK